MSESIGCGDNSCIFKQLRPGGMGTNGGCRCFKNLEAWVDDGVGGRWNKEEVRKVQQDTQRLASELRHAREAVRTAREATMAVIIAKLDELMDAFGRPAECDDDPYWMGLEKAASMVRAMLGEHDRGQR
jgi:hypothetical protein